MVALGQTAFINLLVSSLKAYAPTVDSHKIIKAGATAGVRKLVSHSEIHGVLKAYNHALTGTFVSMVSRDGSGRLLTVVACSFGRLLCGACGRVRIGVEKR